MGISTTEKGVVKLVHPGRHVEVHREPVSAAEIMRKYPRHCIARPDVFKFPYVVVRPESVLLPGKVFYLVPNRTLYALLKTRGQQSQPSLRENQASRNHGYHGYTRQNAPIKCWGGIIPKHKQRDTGHRRRLQSMLQDRTNSHDQDSEGYCSDTSYVDAWTEITNNIRKACYKPYQTYPADLSFDSCISFPQHNVTSAMPKVGRGYNVTSTLPTVRSGGRQTRSLEDVAELKSCFRKQDSQRNFLKLKVTFASPIIISRSPGVSSSPEQIVWSCTR